MRKNGLEIWGPRETRAGRFDGLTRPTLLDDAETARLISRNQGSIRIEMDILARKGRLALLISEENMLGSMRTNLREHSLYPRLDLRLERFAATFGKTCTRVGIAIRPYEEFWASSLAYAIPRGHCAPGDDDLDRLVTQPRTWRRVISEVAQAFPGSDVKVWEFSQFAGRPAAQLRALTHGHSGCWLPPSDCHANTSAGRNRLRQVLCDRGAMDAADNIARGDGVYMPFAAHHIQCFREQYTEDLDWLRKISGKEIDYAEPKSSEWASGNAVLKRGVG